MSNLDEEGQGGASEEGGMAGGTEDEGDMGGGSEGGMGGGTDDDETGGGSEASRPLRRASEVQVTVCYLPPAAALRAALRG